jgi:hypothetical protein
LNLGGAWLVSGVSTVGEDRATGLADEAIVTWVDGDVQAVRAVATNSARTAKDRTV